MRRLSSRQTLWLKVVLPAFWIPLFTAGTVLVIAAASDAEPAVPPFLPWIMLTALGAGAASLYWFGIRLRWVEMDDRALYVSTLRSRARVPLAAIDEVRENRWVNPPVVTITFRHDTDAGRTVAFTPTIRWWGFWRQHPVVEELREAARRARHA